MLHTKFRENRPASSGEEDFWRVFIIYGRGSHLGHVTQMPRTNFCSPNPRRLHIKFDFVWPSGFREEDVWNCERRTTTTDGRTPVHGYTISSPLSLRLRWAKMPQRWILWKICSLWPGNWLIYLIKVYEVPLSFAKHHIDILGPDIRWTFLQDHWSSGIESCHKNFIPKTTAIVLLLLASNSNRAPNFQCCQYSLKWFVSFLYLVRPPYE